MSTAIDGGQEQLPNLGESLLMSAKQVYVTRPLRDYRLYFNRDDAIDAANPFSIYARENFENGCGLSLPVGTLDPVPLTIHFAFKHTKRKLAKRQAP